jgi:8-oxo-dGTP diphosphatase
MNDQCFYRISIKGIVIDSEGRILLTKEDNDKWEMLGGGLDHGEDPLTCLKREIREETGLSLTKIYPVPKYFITSQRIDNSSYIANLIYRIELKNLDFRPSDECQELRFFSLEDMKREYNNLFPNVQRLYNMLSKEVGNNFTP